MAEIERLIKSYLPMSEAKLFCCSACSRRTTAMASCSRCRELTEGRVAMGAGTVYTILYKMENDGLIEVTRTFERRKLYKITPVGGNLERKPNESASWRGLPTNGNWWRPINRRRSR